MSKNKKKKQQPPKKMDYEAIRERDRARKEKKKQQRREKHRKLYRGLGIGAAAAVILLGGGFGGYAYVMHSGMMLNRPVYQTEHFQVTAGMLAYYFKDCQESYDAYLEENPEVESYNPKKSLKKQAYDEDMSWYDMFMKTCEQSLTMNLQLCETAYASGYTLSEADVEECHNNAMEMDLSKYQHGVTVADIEQALQMNRLANAFQYDTIENINITDEEIEAFYEQNEAAYQTVSVLGYAFSWSPQLVLDGDTSEQDLCVRAAEEAAASTSEAQFRAAVLHYLQENTEYSEEDAQQVVSSLLVTNTVGTFTEELQEWIATAKVGDCKTFVHEDQCYAQSYMMVETPKKDESPTADLRVIFLRASDYDGGIEEAVSVAETLKDACKDSGSTPSYFSRIAQNYSADSSSAANGGLLEGYGKNRTTYGKELTDWAFDGTRQAGDMMVFHRSNAAVLAFYEGENRYQTWQSAVYTVLYNKVMESLSADVEGQKVETIEKNRKYVLP